MARYTILIGWSLAVDWSKGIALVPIPIPTAITTAATMAACVPADTSAGTPDRSVCHVRPANSRGAADPLAAVMPASRRRRTSRIASARGTKVPDTPPGPSSARTRWTGTPATRAISRGVNDGRADMLALTTSGNRKIPAGGGYCLHLLFSADLCPNLHTRGAARRLRLRCRHDTR
jgi:hypothetical protein